MMCISQGMKLRLDEFVILRIVDATNGEIYPRRVLMVSNTRAIASVRLITPSLS